MYKVRPFRSKTARAVVAGALSLGVIGGVVLPRISAQALPGVNTLSINDVTLNEGSGGGVTSFTFTVNMNVAATGPVTVGWATGGGTAIGGADATLPNDYKTASGTLSFPTGTTSRTLTVDVGADGAPEANDTFNVTLSNATNASIADGTGVGTIQNDDGLRPTVSVTAPTINETNADQSVNFAVTLSSAAAEPTTVNYATTAGSAAAGADFVSTSGTVTFAAGESSKNVPVTIKGDTLDEDNETFTFALSNPSSNATLSGSNSSATATIIDNDATPTLSIADASATEGAQGSTTPMPFTVSLSAASGKDVKVSYATAASSTTPNATSGVDYVSTTNVLTIPAGQTSGIINVTVVGDNQDEPNEFFDVVLSAPQNATIADGTGTGTINDDDGTPIMSVGNASVTEGNAGTVNAIVSFTLSSASGSTVTADYTTATGGSDGNATAGTDFVAQTGTVSFAPGTTSVTKSFVINGDTIDEANETFSVKLSNVSPNGAATLSATPGVVTINDDDAQPTVTINDVSLDEGNSGVTEFKFTVTLSAASGRDVSVNAATATPATAAATPGVDYTAASGTLNFPAGTTTANFSVNVLGETVDEGNETFNVVLSNGVNVTIPANEAGLGTIKNDDAGPSIIISNPSSPTAEGNSSTSGNPINFTVTLNGAATQKTVTVNYATKDNSAVSGTGTPTGALPDYNAASGTLTFAPGETTKTITVTTIGDTSSEPDETFDVLLSSPVNATIANGTATGQISNDDDPAAIPAVTISDAPNANEGGNHVFTFTVNGTITQTITVNYTTADGPSVGSAPAATQPADYPKTTGTLIFNTTGAKTATVTVASVNDTVDEDDETFHMNITSAGNANIAGDGNGDAKIVDNDAAPTLSIEDKSIAEDVANGSGVVNVTLSAPSQRTITVNYATADGTAKQPGDYTAGTGTLTFAPGDVTKPISVGVINDTLDEVDETLSVFLGGATNATIAKGGSTVTITDDDAPPVISIGQTPTATEGTGNTPSKLSFPVTLSTASGKTVTVVVTPSDGSAKQPGDYTNAPITVTFAPGETTKTADVPVVADSVDEDDETVVATMSSPTNATLAATTTSTGTIVDDDDAPVASLATASPVAESAAKATFVITLDHASAKTVTVKFNTVDVTAKGGSDYNAIPPLTVTFQPGDTTKSVDVQITHDDLDEDDEIFKGVLSAPTDATLGTSEAQTTITDDDAPPSVTIDNASGSEGDVVVFTVTLSAKSGRDVSVKVNTADGTAKQPDDYAKLTDLVVTVPAGDTAKTFSVSAADDQLDEPNETFKATISAPTNATLGTPVTGTGTIIDENVSPKITTGAGAGGGPHVRDFNPDGAASSTSFFAGSDSAGIRVARGDVDGDGVDEIITGVGQGGSALVSVYDAAGNLLASVSPYGTNFTGGVFVAAGDLDGDGDAEIITGAGPGGGPHVRTFSYVHAANSPASLQGSAGFYAFADTFGGGVSVGAADLNDDGKADILTGMASQGSNVRSFTYNGTGTALKGADFNPYAGFTGGAFVAGGDLDGDGKAEIVTSTGPGGGGDPHLRTFSGSGTALGAGVYAYNVGFRGGFSVAVADLDGDGNAEIITGAGPSGGPHVKVWSGGTNGVPEQQGPGFFAYPANFNGGVWVAAGVS